MPARVLLKASLSVSADCTRCSAFQASESAEVWRLKMTKPSLLGYRGCCCKWFNLRIGPQPRASQTVLQCILKLYSKLQSVDQFYPSICQTHIFLSDHPNGVGPAAVLEFWVQVLTSQQLWHRDRATLCLLDDLCKAAFQYSQEDSVQKLLYQQHKVNGCGVLVWLWGKWSAHVLHSRVLMFVFLECSKNDFEILE